MKSFLPSRRFVAVALLAVAAGCAGEAVLFEPKRVERQHEAGSFHFAVLSVAPWEEYASALQPNFHIDEERALQAVVPTTRALEESVLNAVQASVGVKSAKAGAEESTTKEDVAPSGVVVGEDRIRGAPGSSVLDEKIDIDPFLRYTAATALLQEVRLMNRYVTDAAVRRGYRAYAVRMQVALLPAARNEPYDAYATIAFFAPPEAAAKSGGGAGTPETILRGSDGTPSGRRTPQVIPLLATDNLESTMHSKTSDNVRQMAGALFFLSGAFGASADVQSFTKELQGVLGRDLNALMTVVRQSDNSIRVRLGAMQQAASNYAMIPRTHAVTVLVMVPEGTSMTLEAVAKTVMVDAESGSELAERTEAEIEREALRIVARYGLNETGAAGIANLLGFCQRNDQDGFFAALAQISPSSFRHGRTLWLDLAGLMAGGRYAATEFDLPPLPGGGASTATMPDQTALVFDDGKNRSTLTLLFGGPVRKSDVSAVLHVRKGGQEYPLAAEVGEGPVRDRLVLSFPSLSAWGLAPDATEAKNLALSVATGGEARTFAAVYRVKPPEEEKKPEKPVEKLVPKRSPFDDLDDKPIPKSTKPGGGA